jgi:hypothetical protein
MDDLNKRNPRLQSGSINLIYGEVIEVFFDGAMRMGKVKLGAP